MPQLSKKLPASKATKTTRPRQTKWAELLPYPDFPLFAHTGTRWAKVIQGKRFYFGKVSDGWQSALEKYNREKDDLYAGRTPRVQPEGLIVGGPSGLCSRFLTAKKHLVDTRELTPRSFADYFATCERVVRVFGRDRLVIDLAAEDFALLRKVSAMSCFEASICSLAGNGFPPARAVEAARTTTTNTRTQRMAMPSSWLVIGDILGLAARTVQAKEQVSFCQSVGWQPGRRLSDSEQNNGTTWILCAPDRRHCWRVRRFAFCERRQSVYAYFV